MGKRLIKGEKVVISRINDPSQNYILEVSYPKQPDDLYDIDIFAFMLEECDRVNKKNIIFYNHPMSPCESIAYHEYYDALQNKKIFTLHLNKLPDNIQTICFACMIYRKQTNTRDPAYLNLELQFLDKTLHSQMFGTRDKIDLITNDTFLLGEVYKYKDTWKFNAVKQEMNEGLLSVMKKLYNISIY